MNTITITLQNTGKYFYNLPLDKKVIILTIILLIISGSIVLGLYLGKVGVFKQNVVLSSRNITNQTKPPMDTIYEF